MQRRITLAALSVGLALTAGAQDFDDTDSMFPVPVKQSAQLGIWPFIGYRFGGEVQDSNTSQKYSFEDSSSFGLVLDYAPKDYLGRFELLWSHQESSLDFQGNNGLGKVDLTIDVIQVGGLAEYGSERLRPYVSAHIGATHYSADGYGSETKFSFDIGAGVKAFLTKNLYLRGDVRAYCTVVEAEGGFIYANGITVATFTGSTLWQGEASVGIGLTF
jgi:opacity protein-like surface antigen